MAIGTAAAIIGGAVIGAGASILGSNEQSAAADRGIGEQRRQFDLNRSDLAPFRESGVNALGRLNQLAEGDTSGFFTSPGFEFVRDEGLRGIENRFSATGGTLSGNALRRLTEFNSGLASQEFGNFFERIPSQIFSVSLFPKLLIILVLPYVTNAKDNQCVSLIQMFFLMQHNYILFAPCV